MANITFSIWIPLIENTDRGERWKSVRIEHLNSLRSQNLTTSNFKGMTRLEVFREKDTLFLQVETGKTEPRDDLVIDVASGNQRPNPRTPSEIELLRQFFVLFDFRNKLIYLSDVRNKKKLESILSEITGYKFQLKGAYEDRESFINLLHEVEEIKFTTLENIFSTESGKRKALSDLIGSDSFGDCTLDITMKKGIDIGRLRKGIKSFFLENDNHQLNSLLIRGKDDSGFEHVYNIDTFIKKISIVLDKEKNGKYDGDKVRTTLLNSIKELTDVQVKQK